jgi:hypothetical protein
LLTAIDRLSLASSTFVATGKAYACRPAAVNLFLVFFPNFFWKALEAP